MCRLKSKEMISSIPLCIKMLVLLTSPKKEAMLVCNGK
jgi:hypothetical protein